MRIANQSPYPPSANQLEEEDRAAPPTEASELIRAQLIRAEGEDRESIETPCAATTPEDAGSCSSESLGVRACEGEAEEEEPEGISPAYISGADPSEEAVKGLGSTDTPEQPPEDKGLTDFSHHYFGKPRINPVDGVFTTGAPEYGGSIVEGRGSTVEAAEPEGSGDSWDAAFGSFEQYGL
jgi:hypothetical protein